MVRRLLPLLVTRVVGPAAVAKTVTGCRVVVEPDWSPDEAKSRFRSPVLSVSGLMSIQSRVSSMLGTVESALMDKLTMDPRSSKASLLKSSVSHLVSPGGEVDPLDVTSDCPELYCCALEELELEEDDEDVVPLEAGPDDPPGELKLRSVIPLLLLFVAVTAAVVNMESNPVKVVVVS